MRTNRKISDSSLTSVNRIGQYYIKAVDRFWEDPKIKDAEFYKTNRFSARTKIGGSAQT